MKTSIIKVTLLALGFVIGATSLTAFADWTAPASNPPACPENQVPAVRGCDAPIHVGADAQTKQGPLVAYWLGLINNAKLVFSNQLGERVIFYNSSSNPLSPDSVGNYAAGIQNNTLYLRTGSQDDFAIYKGGQHSDTRKSPGGAGGNVGVRQLVIAGADDGGLTANKTYVNDVCLFSDPSKCLSATSGGGSSSVPTGTFSVPNDFFVGQTGTHSAYFSATVIGAQVGDVAVVALPSGYYFNGYQRTGVRICGPYTAAVSSAGVVSVHFWNTYLSQSCVVPPGTYTVKIIR